MITGSSAGIGLAMARAMAHHGAHVVLNGRSEARLEAAHAALSAEGLSVSRMAFDVRDHAAVREAVARTVKDHGKIDIAVANAAASVRKAVLEISDAEFRDVMATNVDAAFALAQAAARHMIPRRHGRLIFVASVYGMIARPRSAEYSASKAGLRGLARALAVELGPQGITSNVVAPGPTRSERTRELQQNGRFSAWVEDRIPLRRWGEPMEQAGAAVFLASPAGAFCNGHVLNVDGGMVVNAGDPW